MAVPDDSDGPIRRSAAEPDKDKEADEPGEDPQTGERTNVFQTPLAPEIGPKRDRAYLIVLAGSSVGEMFKVSRERTVIGRGGRADIRMMDEGVSREHAGIVIEGDRVFVEDLGSTNGTYCNAERVTRRELSDGDKILVGSTTILKFTYHDKFDEVFQRQMYESALRDGLTRAFNKKYFVDRLDSELAYALRHRAPLSLVFFDIDHFKKVNDTYGHMAGDQVLADMAALVAGSIRTEDVFARFGGEEFAVICRGLELEQARVVGDRLRRKVENKPFLHHDKTLSVTISVGIAGLPDPSIAKAADLIAAVDEVLYEAKRTGRNRVCVRKPPVAK